ncbi:MAG TPA: hypothetical protein VM260_06265, partial [Pirellula sp.]|nr:hypothetical protein [Pirellula sp.]
MHFESTYAMEAIDQLVVDIETRDPKRSPESKFDYVDIASVCSISHRIISPKSLLGKDAPSRARKVIRVSDVIFATTRPYLKSVATVPQELDNQICSTGFCVLRTGERVLPEWLFYCVISDQFLSQIIPLMRGA